VALAFREKVVMAGACGQQSKFSWADLEAPCVTESTEHVEVAVMSCPTGSEMQQDATSAILELEPNAGLQQWRWSDMEETSSESSCSAEKVRWTDFDSDDEDLFVPWVSLNFKPLEALRALRAPLTTIDEGKEDGEKDVNDDSIVDPFYAFYEEKEGATCDVSTDDSETGSASDDDSMEAIFDIDWSSNHWKAANSSGSTARKASGCLAARPAVKSSKG